MKQATDGMNIPPCPIDALQGDLLRLLQTPAPVLVTAPPGTGKSSRIPLWLLNADWVRGRRILMLEPRRIAARSLARYMAGLLGETPGRRIGWRMRGDTLTGPECRIEIVTEGVLTRMIQSSPDLENVACIIFDEFHERSLQTDLGLALTLDARSALRPDLRVIVMSATMDAEGLARLLDGSRILRRRRIGDGTALASAACGRARLRSRTAASHGRRHKRPAFRKARQHTGLSAGNGGDPPPPAVA